MNLDLPHHLHATRDLLTASMRTHSSEQAPALPAALLEDLTRSVSIQSTEVRESHFAVLFASLRSMMGSSTFGSAAAAIMVLAVASTVVLRPDATTNKDTFRGANAYSAADSAQVILVAAPAGLQRVLEVTTDFEDGIFSSTATIDGTTDLKGARVIVDFNAGTITSINATGESVYQAELSESTSGLSLEIASALTRL